MYKECLLICFAAFSDYILMQPSEAYTPYMNTVTEKNHLSKIVIEFLTEEQDANYEVRLCFMLHIFMNLLTCLKLVSSF